MSRTRNSRASSLALIAACAALAPFASTAAKADSPPRHVAKHAPLPLIDNTGGAVLSAPHIVPIFYSADPLAASLTSYFANLGTSGYLPAALREYGVAAVTVAPPVVLTDPPPASMLDTDIATWLATEASSGALPAADANTLYQIVYPSVTAVSSGGYYGYPYQTCTPFSFEAYSASSSSPIPFSVVPNCALAFPGEPELEIVTTWSSASLANAITSPFGFEAPAYATSSWHGSGWAAVSIGGIGGLCGATTSDDSFVPADLGFTVQRIWSNHAAQESHNPCAAEGGQGAVYFNAAPDIVGGLVAAGLAEKGLVIPEGASVTIPVRLFSDAPTGDFTLAARERTDLDGQLTSGLSFSFDVAHGRNGDVRQLTITRAKGASLSLYSTFAFEISATFGGVSHEWIGLVGNQ